MSFPTNLLFKDPVKRSRSVFINCPFDNDYTDRFYIMVFTILGSGYLPRCALDSGSTSSSRMERIIDGIHNSRLSVHDLARCHGEGISNFARFNMPFELGISVGHRFLQKEMARIPYKIGKRTPDYDVRFAAKDKLQSWFVGDGLQDRRFLGGLSWIRRFLSDQESAPPLVGEEDYGRQEDHDWLLLVPSGKSYDRFISDLAGYDPRRYDESRQTSIVSPILSWLVSNANNDCGFRPGEIKPDIIIEALPEFLEKNAELLKRWDGSYVPWDETLDIANEILISISS